MNSTHFFPIVLITLDIGAAVVYAYHGNWKMFGYWVSAAAISFFATNWRV